MKHIIFGKPPIGTEEINFVSKVIKSKWIGSGKITQEFENKFRIFKGSKYAISTNSCTSALYLALKYSGVKAGDEVITTPMTFVSTINSIIHVGAKPILADVDPLSFNIDPIEIKKKITKKTKALLIPNLIGNIPDWKKLRKIANKYKLVLIEDSADTLGAKIQNKPTGYYSDVSITSFYGSHVISCAGNGGIMLTNDKNYYLRAKVLRSWGRMSTLIKDSENINKRLGIKLKGFNYDRKFVFSEAGYNFEPSEIGAAFGLEQLKKFKYFSQLRNRNFKYHSSFFKKLNKYFVIPRIENKVRTNFLAYPVILKNNNKFSRKKFQIFLEKHNIQTRPIFSGNILRHPAFQKLISSKNKLNNFKSSDYIMKNGLLIGCHQGLSNKDIFYIHSIILKFLNERITK